MERITESRGADELGSVEDVQCRPAGVEDFPFLATMLGEAAVWRPDKPTPTAEQVMADPRYAMYLTGWPRQGDYGLVAEQDGPVGAAWYRTYSEESHGTTVKIYLPPVVGTAPAVEPAAVLNIEGGHETILVVEDDRLVRTFVVAQIKSLGYLTVAAVNAAEALVVIDSPQKIDLLFTDMIMPGSMNGRQLADAACNEGLR